MKHVRHQVNSAINRSRRIISEKPPRETSDLSLKGEIFKVNVDLSKSMLSELNKKVIMLNISRQAVIKSFVKEGLDRHYLVQKARLS